MDINTTLSRLKLLSNSPHTFITPFLALEDKEQAEGVDLNCRAAPNEGWGLVVVMGGEGMGCWTCWMMTSGCVRVWGYGHAVCVKSQV